MVTLFFFLLFWNGLMYIFDLGKLEKVGTVDL